MGEQTVDTPENRMISETYHHCSGLGPALKSLARKTPHFLCSPFMGSNVKQSYTPVAAAALLYRPPEVLHLQTCERF